MTIENQLFLARFCQNIYGMQRLGKIWLPAQNLIAFHALTHNTLQQQEITVIFVGTLQYLMVRRVLFRILFDRAGSNATPSQQICRSLRANCQVYLCDKCEDLGVAQTRKSFEVVRNPPPSHQSVCHNQCEYPLSCPRHFRKTSNKRYKRNNSYAQK